MPKIFLDSLNTSIRIRIDCMSFCVNESAKLNYKLLETNEVQLLSFSFMKKLDIKIPHKRLNFILGCQEEQFVIFQELDDFNDIKSLVSLLVIFEVHICMTLYCVFTACVLEEKIT